MDRASRPVARASRGGRGASLTARPVSTSSSAAASDASSSAPAGAAPPIIKREPASASAGSFRGRFRPKNARRSEAERAAIAEQEAQKQRERAAEEAKAKPRGRFRGGRSRGNAMGQRGRVMNPTGMFAPRDQSRAGTTDPRSRETTTSRFENCEPRINADKLGLPAGADDSDPEDTFAFYDNDDKFPGLAPMGIYRTKPKKETVTVTTAAEMEAQANAGATSSSSSSLGRDEEDEEIDFKKAISASKSAGPEIQVRDVGGDEINFDRGLKSTHAQDSDDQMDIDVITTAAKDESRDKHKKSSSKAKLPVDPETEQLDADLRLMRNEFSWMKIRDEYTVPDSDDVSDDAAIQEKLALEGIMREGRVYLFQFPPVMPPLRPVKPNASASSSAAAAAYENDDDMAAASAATDNQSGCVGQMIVRKSGRVEMTWGGITYEMRPALKRDFVTSAVLVEYSDEKRRGNGGGAGAADSGQQMQTDGRAVGLGKVMGQFILAPKYEDTSEWAISEEDLKAPEE
ncbi:hypothetical protein TD95_002063 [Thielaviopsis punctulata]|uniref:Uncharacterized protein n=1 Tax=Thielaviopsis punctulata TaxID=72032 RepID=A0A0F4ZH92_9PEZI|nr:hypothetical protein TD95_002063 [Thielaviopsis punctulata]